MFLTPRLSELTTCTLRDVIITSLFKRTPSWSLFCQKNDLFYDENEIKYIKSKLIEHQK